MGILTLPGPGTTNSLSANSDIKVDTIGPKVTSISASNANGYYKAGDKINVLIKFDEPVKLPSGATLGLNVGESASYLSGDGTDEITLVYTVKQGNNVGELACSTSSSLSGYYH